MIINIYDGSISGDCPNVTRTGDFLGLASAGPRTNMPWGIARAGSSAGRRRMQRFAAVR